VLVTAVVEMTTDAEVAPAGIVTWDWTVAFPLFELSVTPTPPTAAGPDSVTVPIEVEPPFTVVGERVKPRSTG
jgi:hypothetical protein